MKPQNPKTPKPQNPVVCSNLYRLDSFDVRVDIVVRIIDGLKDCRSGNLNLGRFGGGFGSREMRSKTQIGGANLIRNI